MNKLETYPFDTEFTIKVWQRRIETSHTPIVGKRHVLFDILTSKENPFGIQFDIETLKQELKLEKLDFHLILEKLNEKEPSITERLLNYIYLQNNFYLLFVLLYHKFYSVRKTAFTLLMNGFEIDPLVMSILKKYFDEKDAFQILVIPTDCLYFFQDYLSRDVTRWLTALYTQKQTDEIWKRYTEHDINLSIANQRESEEIFIPEVIQRPRNNQLISSIVDWLKNMPKSSNANNVNEANIKKVEQLREKWLQSESRMRTVHKILEHLLNTWHVKSDSDFINIFQTFFIGLPDFERQVFFIYGSVINDEDLIAISYKYITEVNPITNITIFSNSKNAQTFVKAIVQAKFFGEENNQLASFQQINEHFSDLLLQLKEVEDIFAPQFITTEPKPYLPIIEPINNSIKNATYPKGSQHLKPHHFEVAKPSIKFNSHNNIEALSALEIQAISAIAIVLGETKTRLTLCPVTMPTFEFKSKIAFKPCSLYNTRHSKSSKANTKKEQRLEDIFGKAIENKHAQNLNKLEYL